MYFRAPFKGLKRKENHWAGFRLSNSIVFGVFEAGDGAEEFFLRFDEPFFRKIGFAQQFLRLGLGTLGPFAVDLMHELSGFSQYRYTVICHFQISATDAQSNGFTILLIG